MNILDSSPALDEIAYAQNHELGYKFSRQDGYTMQITSKEEAGEPRLCVFKYGNPILSAPLKGFVITYEAHGRAIPNPIIAPYLREQPNF